MVLTDAWGSGSTPPMKKSTFSGSGSLSMNWPPAVNPDQVRCCQCSEKHPLAVPDPLEAVSLSVMVNQFRLCIHRDEPVAADFEGELGCECQQTTGDPSKRLGPANILWIGLQLGHLDILLAPFQCNQPEYAAGG